VSETGEPAAATKSGMSTGVRILIFASLALNMFLLGAGAVTLGRLTHHPGGPGFMLQRREFPGPGMMLRALPEAERDRLEDAVKAKRAVMRAHLDAARKARRDALAAFGGSNYSQTVMEARLKAMRDADVEALDAVHDALGSLIGELSPEDRMIIVKAMRSRGPGPGPFGGPDGPPPDGPPPPPEGGP
jgi:uncharacterized membrane protein